MFPSQSEFLKHILDECNYLLHEFNTNSFDEFLTNQRLAKAICRSLEIIGEASKNITLNFKTRYPLVAWKDMAGMRERLIHHYFGVDYETVWRTLKEDIPLLDEWMKIIIEKESN